MFETIYIFIKILNSIFRKPYPPLNSKPKSKLVKSTVINVLYPS